MFIKSVEDPGYGSLEAGINISYVFRILYKQNAQNESLFELCCVTQLPNEAKKLKVVASYPSKEEAKAAYESLFQAIESNRKVWDVEASKK